MIAATLMLNTFDQASAANYLRRVARWMLDRHDEAMSGLGLSGLGEDETVTAARLFGGSLSSTTLDRRPSSYLATAVLDLAAFLGAKDLYEAVRASVSALGSFPRPLTPTKRSRNGRGAATTYGRCLASTISPSTSKRRPRP